MSHQLQVLLLGPPVVKSGQSTMTIPRRQVRALLYRLAVEPRPLSRSALAFLFWSDLPESTARRNLSRLLVYLSRNLPDPSVLLVDGSQIQLDFARTWVDTRAFDQNWDAWKLTHHRKDLQAAVELYRGSYLDGFSLPGNNEFSQWVSQEVERWEQHYLKALEVLIDETAAEEETQLAIDYARQYLLYNDLAEAVHCRLIVLYTELGDRSSAIRQYEQCSEVLERELGVKPAPETYAAYQAVLNPDAQEIDQPAGNLAWTTIPSLHVPFIGRKEALQKLSQSLKRARAGNGGLVLISGEAGIGKSRLLQEFASRQHGRVRVIMGSASPESSCMPYQPLIEALRPVLSSPDILQHVHNSWLVEASRLIPEFAELVQQTQEFAPLEAGLARARLFEGLCRIIFSLCEGGYSVLFCLDDLHWADSTTQDWLAYLARRLRGHRVLVVGSYRIGEIENLAELRQVLTHLADYYELGLSGLNEDDIWRLISFLGDDIPGDKELADRLYKATNGNPFFVLETLRAAQETAPTSDFQTSLIGFPLPDSVLQTVNSRLDTLHPRARQVLEAGAVLGEVFCYEPILLIAGRVEMETLDVLDELVARQFLTEKADDYQFCHAIVREAVYAGLGHWRRRKLHQRAGEVLEKLRLADAITLAWHFERAMEPGRSAGYLLEAGRAARGVFAHVEARGCFDRALKLLKIEAEGLQNPEALAANRRQRIQALYERGWALRLLGEMDAYTRDLEEVAQLARSLDDPRTLAHLHWQQAYNHRWFCRYDAARSSAEKGVRMSREIGDPFLQAVCQRELGMVARETGEFAAAQFSLEQAFDMFVHLQDATYMIHTLGNLSTLYCRMQDPERAMRVACQAMEICEHESLRHERRIPLGDMGAAAAALGNFQQAQSDLEESLSISREIADRTQEIFCEGNLGWIQAQMGKITEAANSLMDALSLTERIGSITEQSWLHARLAEIYVAMEDYHQAKSHARAAFEVAAAHGRKADVLTAQQLLSKLYPGVTS